MIYVNPHTRRLSAIPASGFVDMDEAIFVRWAAPILYAQDLSTRVETPEAAARGLLRLRVWELRHEMQATPLPVSLSGGRTCSIVLDDATLANLTGKVVLGLAGLDGGAARWKQAGGDFIQLSAQDVRDLAGHYGACKQHLFTRESELYALIDQAPDLAALLDLAAVVEAY